MAAQIVGIVKWSSGIDSLGYRSYKLRTLHVTDSVADGPAAISVSSGLPLIGSVCAYGTDIDPWAWCSPEMTFTPLLDGEPNNYWYADQTFTTKPFVRCGTSPMQNPLSEPVQIGGSYVKFTREARTDKDGNPLQSSSFEQLHGQDVELDENRHQIWVEMNTLTLDQETFDAMIDTVNDSEMWGMPPRCIKLSDVNWTRKIYGSCTYYYTRKFTFDIRPYDTVLDVAGFDRVVPDRGRKVLNGRWDRGTIGSPLNPPVWRPYSSFDHTKPNNYIQWKDPNGENTETFLDGDGSPVQAGAEPGKITIQRYPESNFFVLGIPATF